jgi:hypothetical protein
VQVRLNEVRYLISALGSMAAEMARVMVGDPDEEMESAMARKEDLEQAIRESYGLIAEYEAIIRTSDWPEEKARARRAIDEQWSHVEGYLAEYRPLSGMCCRKRLRRWRPTSRRW